MYIYFEYVIITHIETCNILVLSILHSILISYRGLVKWYNNGLQNHCWEFDSLIPCHLKYLNTIVHLHKLGTQCIKFFYYNEINKLLERIVTRLFALFFKKQKMINTILNQLVYILRIMKCIKELEPLY